MVSHIITSPQPACRAPHVFQIKNDRDLQNLRIAALAYNALVRSWLAIPRLPGEYGSRKKAPAQNALL